MCGASVGAHGPVPGLEHHGTVNGHPRHCLNPGAPYFTFHAFQRLLSTLENKTPVELLSNAAFYGFNLAPLQRLNPPG